MKITDSCCNIDMRVVCLRQKAACRIEGCGVGDAALAIISVTITVDEKSQ